MLRCAKTSDGMLYDMQGASYVTMALPQFQLAGPTARKRTATPTPADQPNARSMHIVKRHCQF
jgi:hypothetical protein